MAVIASALTVGTAATATTASTAGLFGAAGKLTLGATLSTLGTAGSLFSNFASSSAQKAQASIQSRQAEYNARLEKVRGQEEANQIKRDVARALASSNARGAASGVDISSGSPVTAQKQALRDANDALSTAGTNAKLREERQRLRAQAFRRQGRNAVRAGFVRSASLLGDFAQDAHDRGVF
ncbi:MAG: hypothetical protein MI685_00025 [Chlorobiales bacterium]|nr:hypothetical protein [Chlorobiales bacterium]